MGGILNYLVLPLHGYGLRLVMDYVDLHVHTVYMVVDYVVLGPYL